MWPKTRPQTKKVAMSIVPTIFSPTFLLAIFFGTHVYLTYGKEGHPLAPIARNLAWNDLITPIRLLPQDPAEASPDKEMLVIRRSLKEHETEINVGVYDLAVCRAIEPVGARLHKADKDLETLRNEVSYKEEPAKLGR